MLYSKDKKGYLTIIFKYFGYVFLRDALLIKKSDHNGIKSHSRF